MFRFGTLHMFKQYGQQWLKLKLILMQFNLNGLIKYYKFFYAI